ncbi:MAG TPA: acetyl-CoA carboxylase biotin carboxyl carrier protein [Caulobacteraceae bacterium]
MAADKGKDDPVDIEMVRKLADLLNETGLSEIEVEHGELRVRVARGLSPGEYETIPVQPAGLIGAPQPAAQPAPASQPAAAPRGDVVKSPMVGTAYRQPNPGADAFVQPGAQVAAGQTLLIIEAMKTMNPVPAPRAGRVLEILVEDGQPVEFGQPLVVLE